MFQLVLKRVRVISHATNEMLNLHIGHLKRAGRFIPAIQTQLDFHLMCFLHKARASYTKQEGALIINSIVMLSFALTWSF